MFIAKQAGLGMPAVHGSCLRMPAAPILGEIWLLRRQKIMVYRKLILDGVSSTGRKEILQMTHHPGDLTETLIWR